MLRKPSLFLFFLSLLSFAFFALLPAQKYSQTTKCRHGQPSCAPKSGSPSGSPSHEAPIYNYQETVHPVTAQKGMVSTQNALATRVGLEILKKGGNAVDAAVGWVLRWPSPCPELAIWEAEALCSSIWLLPKKQ